MVADVSELSVPIVGGLSAPQTPGTRKENPIVIIANAINVDSVLLYITSPYLNDPKVATNLPLLGSGHFNYLLLYKILLESLNRASRVNFFLMWPDPRGMFTTLKGGLLKVTFFEHFPERDISVSYDCIRFEGASADLT